MVRQVMHAEVDAPMQGESMGLAWDGLTLGE